MLEASMWLNKKVVIETYTTRNYAVVKIRDRSTGEIALSLFIALDLEMPERDGREALNRLHAVIGEAMQGLEREAEKLEREKEAEEQGQKVCIKCDGLITEPVLPVGEDERCEECADA